MIAFEAKEGIRTWLMVLDRGDYVIEEIQKFIDANGISTGLITSGLGSFDILSMHTITTTTVPAGENHYTVEGHPLECGSMQGSIAGGVPHIHVVVQDTDSGKIHIGHLHEGSRICFRAEIGIVSLEGAKTKTRLNPDNGVIGIVEG